ncbi:unnamed protein product [Owenia fusiformis]|uniref:Uncharacterized protein n=1 Tax=Owenia fusiformis TaxID=6347 RepID=A0A8J1XFY3_OWEFU|nr:unnamed protein product [Owenia fusiformis]
MNLYITCIKPLCILGVKSSRAFAILERPFAFLLDYKMAEADAEVLRRRVQQKVATELHDEIYKGTSKDPRTKLLKRKHGSAYSISNILWMVLALITFYMTDFYLTVLYDPSIRRTWLNFGVILIGVNLAIGAFLIVWLSWVKKIPSDDWETLYPAAIPIATGSFALGAVSLTIGLWPVWNIFTPVILFVQSMGVVVFIAMLPNF